MAAPARTGSSLDGHLYQQLDLKKQQIRLLRLVPSFIRTILGKTHLVCPIELEVFDIETAPPYTALSYRWGPPSPSCNVMVNSNSISIRENLYNFFKEYGNLRSGPDEPSPLRYMWVDQISINQSDVAERNHQVQLMSTIYSRASRVLVWLGSKLERGAGDKPTYRDAAIEYNKEKKDTRTRYYNLHYILSNRYFQRLWTVQELLLARKLSFLIGNQWWNLHYSDLNSTPLSSAMSHVASTYFRSKVLQGDAYTLQQCLLHFSNLECHDPRDKIYGLMGIVRTEQAVPVDYAKSASHLYADVVHKLIQFIADDEDCSSQGSLRSTYIVLFHRLALYLYVSPAQRESAMEFNLSLESLIAPMLEDCRPRSMLKERLSRLYIGFEPHTETSSEGVWWCELDGKRSAFGPQRDMH